MGAVAVAPGPVQVVGPKRISVLGMPGVPALDASVGEGRARRRPIAAKLRLQRVEPGLALALFVAALLRLPAIGQQSFWLDEAATLNVLHRSLGGMFPAIVHHESTPPLYYVLAWAWAHVFGYSEAGVRS